MTDEPEVSVSTHDFVSARQVARSFSAVVSALVSGERLRVIVLHRNKPSVVMLSWPEYARLQAQDRQSGSARHKRTL